MNNADAYSSVLAPGLKKLIWIGAAAAWIGFGLYVYKFVYSTGAWFVLSESKQEWGTFGDYFGGILNPFFSYLAFLGVIFTVILQARQLDTMRQQAGHEEMQRVQSTISERVDVMLDRTFKPTEAITADTPLPPVTVRDAITQLGMFVVRPRPGNAYVTGAQDHEVRARLVELSHHVFPLLRELESLGWMMTRYRDAGGHAAVLEYYTFRFAAVVTLLDALGLAEPGAYPRLHELFKPREHRDQLAGVKLSQ